MCYVPDSTMAGNRYEPVLNQHVMSSVMGFGNEPKDLQDGAEPHLANPLKQLLNNYL